MVTLAKGQVGTRTLVTEHWFVVCEENPLILLGQEGSAVGKPHAKGVSLEYKATVVKRDPKTWPTLAMSMRPKTQEHSGA